MAYLTRHFKWDASHESGVTGWMPVTAAHNELFMGSMGVGVAHDTLEHFKCDGTVEDELLAFGAIYFIRLETDRLNDLKGQMRYMRRAPEEVIAQDLTDVFCDNHFADILPKRQGYSLEAEFFRECKERMWGHFAKNVEAQERDGGPFEVSDDRTEEDVAQFRLYMRAWFDTAFAWMHSGFCRSLKRWNGPWPMDAWSKKCEAADLFWQLANDVEELSHHSKEWEEGETLTVHVNIKRRSYNLVTSRGNRLDI